MEYKIEIETYAGQKMVHTYIAGLLSVEEHDHVSTQTVKALEGGNINKTIWDVREAKFQYSLIRMHIFVLNAKAVGLRDENYSAVIYREQQKEYEHAKNVAEGMNLRNLSFFQDINHGIEWLMSREIV